jgi:pheromone shutdown protein TraB
MVSPVANGTVHQVHKSPAEEDVHMIRAVRYLYAALAFAFVLGILLQIYFIGLALFDNPKNAELHANFGWLLHLGPLPILVAAALARAGRTQILQGAALAVTFFFVPILAAIRTDAPLTAAFHPVAAVLGFLLAVVVARGARRLVRSPDEGTPTTMGEWLLVALVVAVILFLSFSGSPEA